MERYSICCASVDYKVGKDKVRVESGQMGEKKDTQAIPLADLQEVFVGHQSPLVIPQGVFVGHQSAHATLQRVIGCIKCAPAIFFALFGGCGKGCRHCKETSDSQACKAAWNW